jgi:hypothetical protein
MIKEKLAKLIDLKSILSLIVVVAYTTMVFMKIVEPEYKDIVLMIMTFYFASKSSKKEGE